MDSQIIDGRKLAAIFREGIADGVRNFRKERGIAPGLGVLLVGDNPASEVYVRNKQDACSRVGIRSELYALPVHATQLEVLRALEVLNGKADIHGILVQLPLPGHIDAPIVISHINPLKDVDGLHSENLGLLMAGQPRFIPCTPLGCIHLIHSVMPDVTGKLAVVVGMSLLVGRPMALFLGFENATVVQAHAATVNLSDECRRADILVSATGKPGLITPDHVKPGAVVIDIGITRVGNADGTYALKGDVAFEEVKGIAGAITPVPGGVGPMTVAYLLSNTLKAASLQTG